MHPLSWPTRTSQGLYHSNRQDTRFYHTTLSRPGYSDIYYAANVHSGPMPRGLRTCRSYPKTLTQPHLCKENTSRHENIYFSLPDDNLYPVQPRFASPVPDQAAVPQNADQLYWHISRSNYSPSCCKESEPSCSNP